MGRISARGRYKSTLRCKYRAVPTLFSVHTVKKWLFPQVCNSLHSDCGGGGARSSSHCYRSLPVLHESGDFHNDPSTILLILYLTSLSPGWRESSSDHWSTEVSPWKRLQVFFEILWSVYIIDNTCNWFRAALGVMWPGCLAISSIIFLVASFPLSRSPTTSQR